ncbi:hypothetical protein [Nitrosovibrio sp. Nv17]|uniref:hypothetical protein n=1 Tax=Nitrosovibrio sp. Nv17 TaxID=1855339 RepID=UPI0009084FCC|nr:hypothetical protein [Nitrosovibrio sp. Nv17]SFW38979.1 hypothetical protein SAMN05216414_1313 [Nitrosovibrio sp. Nv17]
MKLKLSKIALAVAVLGTTPAAFALTPAQIAAGPTTYVWLSGASAPSNAVFRSVMALCKDANSDGKPDDAHVYMQGTGKEPGKSSGDRVAYACTMGANAGSLEDKKVVVYHTVENGSFNSYSPHLKMAGDTNPELLPSLQRVEDLKDLGAGGKCANGAAVFDLPAPLDTVGRYNNCSVVTKNFSSGNVGTPGQDYPDGGFSDTEYLINKQNLAINTDLSAIGTELATNIGQAFGVAVSYPLYYRLQRNDIKAGYLSGSCDSGSASAPNLTLACQPNLPAQRYTAIVGRDSINGVTVNFFDNNTDTGMPNSKLHLVRRVPTSGTQSASNARFLGKPCATGVSQGAQDPARGLISGTTPSSEGDNSTAVVKITEWPSTGGVKTKLDAASQAGEFAVGVVSAENTPAGAGANDRWAFVKLNRVSPNPDAQQRAEALDGSYDFWYELVAFTAAGVSSASPEGAELIAAVTTTLGETDLKGIFATPAAGASGPTSRGGRFGNSCQFQGE